MTIKNINTYPKLALATLVSIFMFSNVSYAALVAHYSMDEGQGAVLHDFSGNSNNGTIYGASWTSGVSGTALGFDGVDDYVDIDFDGGEFNLNTYTLTVWAKVNDWGNWDGIISIYDTEKNRIDLELWNDETIHCYVRTNNQFQVSLASEPITIGQWNHFAIAVDTQASEISFYQNGILMGSNTSFGYPGTNLSNFNIGRRDITGNNFGGVIDDVSVYDHVLTGEEIAAAVPEPSTILILLLGGYGVFAKKISGHTKRKGTKHDQAE